MSKIALTRIDSRLIHGQVHSSVIKSVTCKKLIIVDDDRLDNKFEKKLLKAACPSDLKFELIGTEEAGQRAKDGTFTKDGPIFLLFANITNAYKAYKAGLKFTTLQVGGMRDIGNNRKQVYPQCNLNEEESKMFLYLISEGVDCFYQVTSADGKTPVEPTIRKAYPNL